MSAPGRQHVFLPLPDSCRHVLWLAGLETELHRLFPARSRRPLILLSSHLTGRSTLKLARQPIRANGICRHSAGTARVDSDCS